MHKQASPSGFKMVRIGAGSCKATSAFLANIFRKVRLERALGSNGFFRESAFSAIWKIRGPHDPCPIGSPRKFDRGAYSFSLSDTETMVRLTSMMMEQAA